MVGRTICLGLCRTHDRLYCSGEAERWLLEKEGNMPGVGISIFIGAVGAIMRYAITATTQGFDMHTAGVILMFVGVAGAIISLLFWTSLSPWNRENRSSRLVETTTDDGHVSGRVITETRDR
jgi:hypothetical protein